MKVLNYIPLKRFMSRLYRNPIMEGLSLESVIQYMADFTALYGFPVLYKEDTAPIHIENYRGLLPSGIVNIIQVFDHKTKSYIRPTTATVSHIDRSSDLGDNTYRIQGNMIVTSHRNCELTVIYNTVPTDDDGIPMIPDNQIYLMVLESYIKQEYYELLAEQGKISFNILGMVKNDYAWKSGQLLSEFNIPSMDEMENISNMWNRMLVDTHQFQQGFKNMSNKENLLIH